MGDLLQREYLPKLGWNRGELELNYTGYMYGPYKRGGFKA